MTPLDPRQRDAQWLARIAAGDRQAFDALHRAHHRAVNRLALGIVGDPEEARDVAQEVFLRLLGVADGWRPEAKVSTWLHRTTLNVSLTMRRRLARWWSRSGPGHHDVVDPEHALALGEAERAIIAGLEQLSPRQRAVVTLHLDLGFSPGEIAAELEMTSNAARLALSKGLRALRRGAGPAVSSIVEKGAGV